MPPKFWRSLSGQQESEPARSRTLLQEYCYASTQPFRLRPSFLAPDNLPVPVTGLPPSAEMHEPILRSKLLRLPRRREEAIKEHSSPWLDRGDFVHPLFPGFALSWGNKAVQTTEPRTTLPVEISRRFVHWTPVIAGALVAAALSLVLIAFGTSLGLSVARRHRPGETHRRRWRSYPGFICF
jgi:hypothetical protein